MVHRNNMKNRQVQNINEISLKQIHSMKEILGSNRMHATGSLTFLKEVIWIFEW